jgi:hypothetical protein
VKTGGHCAYCGIELELNNWTIDHVQAKSRGGGNELSNLMPSCHRCNQYKKAKTVSEFRYYVLESTLEELRSSIDRITHFRQALDFDASTTIELLTLITTILKGGKISFAMERGVDDE